VFSGDVTILLHMYSLGQVMAQFKNMTTCFKI